jgi:hypothetical protein
MNGLKLKRRSFFVRGVIGLALLLMAGRESAAKSIYYRVVGVADNDVLYVRQHPDPQAAVVTSLPPGTPCVRWQGKSATYQGRPWWFVGIFDGRNNRWIEGWVNAKFLAPQKGSDSCDG